MTSKNNPLLPIQEAFEIAKGAFEVTKKAITHLNGHNLLDNAPFASQSSTEVKESLRHGFSEIEDLFVVSFWAAFERFLRNYLQEKGTTLQKTLPSVLGQTMYTFFEAEVEYWNLENLLELILKDLLGPQKALVSQAKHILHYRNWVAHGKNPKVKNPPSRISPQFAYRTLSDIIELLILNQ